MRWRGAAALSGLLLGAEVIGPPAWGGCSRIRETGLPWRISLPAR